MYRSFLAVLLLLLAAPACDPGDPEGEGTVVVDDAAQGEDSADGDGGNGGGLGTRSNPVPLGERVQVGPAWQVALIGVERDALQQVQGENQFNEPPVAGRQFVMGTFSVSYVGEESGTPWVDLSMRFNGSEGNTFGSGQDDYCGVIPNPLDDAGEMFPGAEAEGNVCVSVPTEQVEGGLFLVEQSMSFEPTRVFFDLQ